MFSECGAGLSFDSKVRHAVPNIVSCMYFYAHFVGGNYLHLNVLFFLRLSCNFKVKNNILDADRQLVVTCSLLYGCY